MGLADVIESLPRKNKGGHVQRALDALEAEDREAWLQALDSGDYARAALAEVLQAHTGVEITKQRVTDYVHSPNRVRLTEGG